MNRAIGKTLRNVGLSAGASCMVLAICAAWDNARAQTGPSSVDPGQIEKRFEEPKLPRTLRGPLVETPTEKAMPSQEGQPSFTLNRVELRGATIYEANALESDYKEYIGQSVTFADLQEIARRITAHYRRDGYVLSKAIIAPQKLQDGHLVVQVIEGYVDNVVIQGDIRGRRSLLDSYAAKIKDQKPLNVKTLERYLLLADDLPGVKARGVLQPSPTASGASQLVMMIEHDPVEAAISVDNRGSRFLGREQATGVVALNSVMGLYERTTVRGILSAEPDELRYIDIAHEEQVGTEGGKVLARVAKTWTNPGSSLEPLDIEGDNLLLELQGVYPFLRTRNQNLSGRVGLAYRDSTTDALGIEIYDDNVRTVSAGISYDFADSYRGVNLIDLEVTQGLDVLGASDSGAGRSRANADSTFTRANLEVSRIQDIYGNWSMFVSARGQVANDALLSSEEFAVGGAAYGRAYDTAEITGDHGAAGRVEIRYGEPVDTGYGLTAYQGYVFYDGGAVWNKDPLPGEPKKATLSSAGFGVRTNFTHDLSGSAEVAFPLTRKIASESTDGDDARVFLSLTKRM